MGVHIAGRVALPPHCAPPGSSKDRAAPCSRRKRLRRSRAWHRSASDLPAPQGGVPGGQWQRGGPRSLRSEPTKEERRQYKKGIRRAASAIMTTCPSRLAHVPLSIRSLQSSEDQRMALDVLSRSRKANFRGPTPFILECGVWDITRSSVRPALVLLLRFKRANWRLLVKWRAEGENR